MLELDDTPTPEPVQIPVQFIGRNFVRLRVRRVNERALALEVRRAAQESGDWEIRCVHGGSVVNAYKSPADTEAVLAVANPAGLVVVWMARLPANKVTLSGAANACLKGSRPLFDKRCGDDAREAVLARLKAAHRDVFPPTAHEHLLRDVLDSEPPPLEREP